MGENLFVAGFPYETSQDELARIFSSCGTVRSAKILVDRVTGRSRGLGFVLMSSAEEGRAAIAKLNGSEVGHRKIVVTEARPAPEKGEIVTPTYTGPDRRSGQDRRRGASAAKPQGRPWEKKPWDKDRKPAFGEKKPWAKKPWKKDEPEFAREKPWKKKPWDKMHEGKGKPHDAPPHKKWGAAGPHPGRKPGDFKSKPGGFKRRPGGGFRG